MTGILPQGFHPDPPADVFIPLQADPESINQGHYLLVAGRLKPGVTVEAAKADLKLAGERFREANPKWMDKTESVTVLPLREALDAFQKARQLSAAPHNAALVAYGHAVIGEKETARKLLEELTMSNKQPSADASLLAFIHLALGEKDVAFALLDKAYAEQSRFFVDLNVDPVFDSVRAEPRFVALLRKMNFP